MSASPSIIHCLRRLPVGGVFRHHSMYNNGLLNCINCPTYVGDTSLIKVMWVWRFGVLEIKINTITVVVQKLTCLTWSEFCTLCFTHHLRGFTVGGIFCHVQIVIENRIHAHHRITSEAKINTAIGTWRSSHGLLWEHIYLHIMIILFYLLPMNNLLEKLISSWLRWPILNCLRRLAFSLAQNQDNNHWNNKKGE